MLYVIPEASTELGWNIGLPLLLALVLFALAVPIWVSLGFAAIGLLVMTDVLPLTLFGEALFSGIDTFALIAIPLFILTGDVLVRSGLSGKLLDVAEATMGSLRSGFGTSTVLGCGFLA
jgi:TRAP-type mannitol/chloroaromatic compound transport system permease large subunit